MMCMQLTKCDATSTQTEEATRYGSYWYRIKQENARAIKYCNATILTTTTYYRCDVWFYEGRRHEFRLNHELFAFDSCVRPSACSAEGRLSDEAGIY